MAGSSAIADAVDEALAQLVAAGLHVGEPAAVKDRWILYAKHRILDEQRSAAAKLREPVAMDELAQALTSSVSGELSGRPEAEESRTAWRVRELLSQLHGDQRRWAEAWCDAVLSGSLPPGGQPRGLAEAFGWSASKTKSVSQRARRRMAAFADQRARGAVCVDRQGSLDDFILATASSAREEARAGLDQARYAQVLFHIAGCEDCWAAWHARRRSLRGHLGALLAPPLSWPGGIGRAVRAKLAGLVSAAHGGAGGAASLAVTSVGGTASVGGNVIGICVGVVCAAAAGGGALILASPSHHRHPSRAHTAVRATRASAASASPAGGPAHATPARSSSPSRGRSTTSARSFDVVLEPQTPAAHGVVPSASLSLRVLTGRGELCWTFSSVVGIRDPTSAFLNIGGVGTLETPLYYIPLGGHYAASGCTKPGPAAFLGRTPSLYLSGPERLSEFLRLSAQYYVEIDEPNHRAVVSATL